MPMGMLLKSKAEREAQIEVRDGNKSTLLMELILLIMLTLKGKGPLLSLTLQTLELTTTALFRLTYTDVRGQSVRVLEVMKILRKKTDLMRA